ATTRVLTLPSPATNSGTTRSPGCISTVSEGSADPSRAVGATPDTTSRPVNTNGPVPAPSSSSWNRPPPTLRCNVNASALASSLTVVTAGCGPGSGRNAGNAEPSPVSCFVNDVTA